jgi:hypothetical protein
VNALRIFNRTCFTLHLASLGDTGAAFYELASFRVFNIILNRANGAAECELRSSLI